MADRFPSLEDFDSGGKLRPQQLPNVSRPRHQFADITISTSQAQTDVQDPTAEPSADDFLAREKAILGDDADKFATAEDAPFEDDLLGGGGDGGDETAAFESQFPDISGPTEVRLFIRVDLLSRYFALND